MCQALPGNSHSRGPALETAPVVAQCLEQLRAKHDIAILAPLAAVDMNDHALAVDVADLQMGHFGATRARGIQSHQHDAMKGTVRRVDQTRDLLLAENLR